MILLYLELLNDRRLEIISKSDGDEKFSFDEIWIVYYYKKNQMTVFDDFLYEGLKSLQILLQRALNDEIEITDENFVKGIGYEWNIISHKIANDELNTLDTTSTYELWSTTNEYANSVWLYNYKGDIYLEVSPQYKWNYSEPEDEGYTVFENFIGGYKYYDRIKIDRNRLLECQHTVNEILEHIRE